MALPVNWVNGNSVTAAFLNLLGTEHNALLSAIIVPELFGAIGDGTTNDTLAMQNWLNMVTASPGHRMGMLTSGKTYRITSELTINSTNSHEWHINGCGATIRQATNNLAIIRFTVEDMYGCTMKNIVFDYTSQQSAATGKAAVCFDCSTGLIFGWRMFQFENIVFNNCFRGFQTLDTGFTNTVWGTEFKNIIGNYGMTGTLISLRSPTGMPNNSFNHIYHMRELTSAAEPTLNLYQNFNVSISNLETNQSSNGGTEILLEGCYNATLNNIRTENGTLASGASLWLFKFCKAVTVNCWQAQNRTYPAATSNIFEGQNNSLLSIGPGMITQYDQPAAGSNLRVLLLDGTSKCTRYEGVIRPSGVADGVSALTTGTYSFGSDRMVTL